MFRTLASALGLAALGTAALVPSAQAAGTGITVTSPRCGVITVTNANAYSVVVDLDSRDEFVVGAHASVTQKGFSGGDYYWNWGPAQSEPAPGIHRATVQPCAGSTPRPVDGDQNGDGKADVLGIQANSGDLYYYRMTATGLASGGKAGSGWNSMVFMQQVNELQGEGTGNYLFAIRNDGTLWRYDNLGRGRFQNGRQVGSGFSAYDNFTITQLNNSQFLGGHVLLARKGDGLYGWVLDPNPQALMAGQPLATGWANTVKTISVRDFDGDNANDLITIRDDGTMWLYGFGPGEGYPSLLSDPKQVGSGWGAMQTVTSPGSLDGDHLSDLVSRRSDGNLYKYINKGGVWGPATQIGRNWNSIRLLA